MSNLQAVTDHLWINSSELFLYHSGIFVSERSAVVIDPGLSEKEIHALAHAVQEKGWNVETIILTHGHWDHILGTEAFPNARIIAQQIYLTSPRNDPTGLARIVEKTTDLGRTTPFKMPVPSETFDEQMQVKVGALSLDLLHTPGHAPDHLFIFERASGTVWTADMLSDEEIPYVIDNLGSYERTLEKIRLDDCHRLVACHATPADARDEIRARLESDRTYISELRERVQAALKAGMSLDETNEVCAHIPYRQAFDNNRGAHRRNVESAYAELGGPMTEPVGWQRAWLEFTS